MNKIGILNSERDRKQHFSKGFSLIEMLLVLSVMGIILAFTAPSLLTLESTSLSGAGREFSGFMNLCRSKAIAGNTVIRLGVVTESANQEEVLSQYAAWQWSKETRTFFQESKWNALPGAVGFDDATPAYILASQYAQDETSSVRGDFALATADDLGNEFEEEGGDGVVRTMKFIQFSPSGRVSVPNGEGRQLILIMRDTETPAESVKNWVQFTSDTLTGRTRVYRP